MADVQKDDNEENAPEVVNNPPMNLEGSIAPKQSAPLDQRPVSQPAQPSFSDEDKSAAARAITGATPALMSFLFGASPLSAESAIQQGQQYYKESTPQKLTTTVNAQGVPVYTDIRNAPGQQAFIKPLRPSGVGVKDVTYIENGKPVYGRTDISGNVTEIGTGRVLNQGIAAGTIMPAVQTQTAIPFTDVKGGQSIAPINKFATIGQNIAQQSVKVSPGLGDVMKTPSQAQAQQQITTAAGYPAQIAPLVNERGRINTAMALLNGDPMANYAGIVKATQDVLNQSAAEGSPTLLQNPGLYQQLKDRLNSQGMNQYSSDNINSVKQILTILAQTNNEVQNRMANITAQSVGLPQNTPMLSRPTPIPNVPQTQKSGAMTREQFMALPKAQRDALIKGNR